MQNHSVIRRFIVETTVFDVGAEVLYDEIFASIKQSNDD